MGIIEFFEFYIPVMVGISIAAVLFRWIEYGLKTTERNEKMKLRKELAKKHQREVFKTKENYLARKKELIEELERYIKELNEALKQFKKEKWLK